MIRPLAAWSLTALVLCGLSGGCVQRRMLICSNPPGALVYVDDYEIGTTPISTYFTYYGQRKIRLVKDGYETLTIMQSIPAPWYEVPPLDFFSENFVPGELRDQRTLTYQLVPQVVVPPDQLLSRGEGLRRGVHAVAGSTAAPGAPAVRIGPVPSPAGRPPAPAGAEPIATPPGVGGQPVYPLPPR